MGFHYHQTICYFKKESIINKVSAYSIIRLTVSSSNSAAYSMAIDLLHSERPKFYAILAFLSAIGLIMLNVKLSFSSWHLSKNSP